MTRVVFFQCRDIQNDVVTRSFFETPFLSQQLFSYCNSFLLAHNSFLSQPEAFVATSNNISILSSCRNLKILCRDLVSLGSSHPCRDKSCLLSASRYLERCRDKILLSRFFFVFASCLLSQQLSLGPNITSCRDLDSLSRPEVFV